MGSCSLRGSLWFSCMAAPPGQVVAQTHRSICQMQPTTLNLMHIFNASLAVPTAKDLRQAISSTACGKVARCSRSGHHGIDWTLAPGLFTSCFRCGSIRPPVKLGTPRSVPPSPVAKVLTRSKAEANRVANNSEAHSASGIALCTTVERKSKRLCARGCGTA